MPTSGTNDGGKVRDAWPMAGRAVHRASGFSLLEMLLVLVLVAAAGMLAATVFSGGVDGLRLRSAAKEIAAQLRQTRAQAVVLGEPQRFTIVPSAHAWQASTGQTGKIPPALQVQFVGARQTQARIGEESILFFPDGGSTGGRVLLQARRMAWRIDVAWLTGEVRLSPTSEGTAP